MRRDGLITGYNYIWRSFTCTLIKLNYYFFFLVPKSLLVGWGRVIGGSEGGRQGLLKKILCTIKFHTFFIVSPLVSVAPPVFTRCVRSVSVSYPFILRWRPIFMRSCLLLNGHETEQKLRSNGH
jgi:hypothetical protein